MPDHDFARIAAALSDVLAAIDSGDLPASPDQRAYLAGARDALGGIDTPAE